MIDLDLLVYLWEGTTFIGSVLSAISVWLAYGDWRHAKVILRQKIALNRLCSESVKLLMMVSFFIVGILVLLAGVREGDATYVSLILFTNVFLMMMDTGRYLYTRGDIYKEAEMLERQLQLQEKQLIAQDKTEVRQEAREEYQTDRQAHQDVREVYQDKRQIRQDERDSDGVRS